MQIKTERLLLRPLEDRDLEDLHAIYSHPDAMRYWSTLPHTSLEETAKLLRGSMEAPAQNAQFAAQYQGRVIGRAGFWPAPETGYILHPDHWRKGFGTEIMQALVAYGFDSLGFDHITADIDPDNVASERLLTKLGFHETHRARKTIQIGGTWYDSIYFRLDAPS